MSPRPRKRNNTALPSNLYTVNGGKQFRYKHPVTGKFHGMGSDRLEAIKAAKQLNSLLMPETDLVARVISNETLAAHCEWFMGNLAVEREYSSETLAFYRKQIRKLVAAHGQKAISDITVQDVAGLMENFPPATANQLRKVSVAIFKAAMARGLIDSNPADATLKRVEKKQRKRLRLEWFNAIHAKAEPWLQNAMDLALLTLQRRQDVLKMRFDGIRDGRLYVVQSKTKKYDSGYLAIAIGEKLDAVIKRCRDNVASPYLVHRKPSRKLPGRKGGDHWTSVAPRTLSNGFAAARSETGLFDGWNEYEVPTFHEIRALGIKLYKDAGKDPQGLAGHASKKMTSNYDSGHEDIRWNEVEADLNLG